MLRNKEAWHTSDLYWNTTNPMWVQDKVNVEKLSTCHRVIVSSCQLVIVSSCHLVNLMACELLSFSACTSWSLWAREIAPAICFSCIKRCRDFAIPLKYPLWIVLQVSYLQYGSYHWRSGRKVCMVFPWCLKKWPSSKNFSTPASAINIICPHYQELQAANKEQHIIYNVKESFPLVLGKPSATKSDVFSVTRRSRSDVGQWVSESLMVSRLDWCDPGEWWYL